MLTSSVQRKLTCIGLPGQQKGPHQGWLNVVNVLIAKLLQDGCLSGIVKAKHQDAGFLIVFAHATEETEETLQTRRVSRTHQPDSHDQITMVFVFGFVNNLCFVNCWPQNSNTVGQLESNKSTFESM